MIKQKGENKRGGVLELLGVEAAYLISYCLVGCKVCACRCTIPLIELGWFGRDRGSDGV